MRREAKWPLTSFHTHSDWGNAETRGKLFQDGSSLAWWRLLHLQQAPSYWRITRNLNSVRSGARLAVFTTWTPSPWATALLQRLSRPQPRGRATGRVGEQKPCWGQSILKTQGPEGGQLHWTKEPDPWLWPQTVDGLWCVAGFLNAPEEREPPFQTLFL